MIIILFFLLWNIQKTISHTPFFTYRDGIEGNIGIGTIPYELNTTLDNISKEYYDIIPYKSSTTFHTYYTELQGSMKQNFDIIQYHLFWNRLCENKCIYSNVIEMNEIYYSNPKPNFEKTNLYGAAANLIPHRDCILFNFKYVNLYRIIVGVTDNNTDVTTHFIHFNMKHKMNKGDYMVFDFDRTIHRVEKTGNDENPRILLKMHYIVCVDDTCSKEYLQFVSFFYIVYYRIARYTEAIGTDPTTFMGFFYGLLWEFPFYSSCKYYIASVFLLNYHLLGYVIQVKPLTKMMYTFFIIIFMYICIVSYYYGVYLLYKIR